GRGGPALHPTRPAARPFGRVRAVLAVPVRSVPRGNRGPPQRAHSAPGEATGADSRVPLGRAAQGARRAPVGRDVRGARATRRLAPASADDEAHPRPGTQAATGPRAL